MKTIKRTYGAKYRIRPNDQQKRLFIKTFGCTRKLYNLYVEEAQKRDEKAKEWHENNNTNEAYPYEWNTNKTYKEEYPFLKEIDSLALMNTRQNFFQARKDYFEGKSGSPNFKNKNKYPKRFTTNNQNYHEGKGTIRVYEDKTHAGKHYLHIPKLTKKTGDIPIILHKPIIGVIHQATISLEADGSWVVSLLIVEEITIDDDYQNKKSFIGCDLGLKSFLVDSNGNTYNDDEDYSKLEYKLKKEQRKLGKQAARLKKQNRRLSECKNYQKQKNKVANIQAKIKHKREDFRHKLSRSLVNNHDLIVIEDLNVKGMLKIITWLIISAVPHGQILLQN